MSNALTHFLEKLRLSLTESTLVKLTLSKPCGADRALQNCYGRIIEVKEGRVLSLVYRYATRDVTKNYSFKDGVECVGVQLGREFEEAHLLASTGTWRLRWSRDGHGSLKVSRPVNAPAPPSLAHDRPKVREVGNATFLQALGVTDETGKARVDMTDKLRQVERFVELLGHLVEQSPLHEAKEVRVCDMGAGKGYLTFAVHDYFSRREVTVQTTGVEVRADLVEQTNRVAQEVGFAGLQFAKGSIESFKPVQPPDLLMALHACDTATDDALFAGIRANAALIVTSPCCHKEVRKELKVPQVLCEVLRHGILAERQAELLTDGLRALLLEMHGYEAKVFEFISNEHTGKNLLIAATRRAKPVDVVPLRQRFRELITFFGLREQRLAKLLGEL